MKAIADFIPLLIFFYFAKTADILTASLYLMISSVIVYGTLFIIQQAKLEKSQWITLILTVAFCSLTILLKNDIYLRWKSPVINGLFAFAFLISPLIGKLIDGRSTTLTERMMSRVFGLSPRGWLKLNVAWVLFFAGMAVAHALFAFVWPTWWIDFKTFGGITLTTLFLIGQFVLLRKYIIISTEPPASK